MILFCATTESRDTRAEMTGEAKGREIVGGGVELKWAAWPQDERREASAGEEMANRRQLRKWVLQLFGTYSSKSKFIAWRVFYMQLQQLMCSKAPGVNDMALVGDEPEVFVLSRPPLESAGK